MQEFIATGRLCNDPRINIKEDTMAASFTVAVSRDYRKEGGPESDFFRCVGFNQRAKFAESFLHKGMKVEMKGQIRTGFYEQNGYRIPTIEVILSYLNFAESKAENEKYYKTAITNEENAASASGQETVLTESGEDESGIPRESSERDVTSEPYLDDLDFNYEFSGIDSTVTCPVCGCIVADTAICSQCGAQLKHG